MNKKWVTIGVLGVLVLGGGYWTYKHFTAKPAVASNITAKAKMGNVSKVITATGTVNFPHAIPLSFQQAGKIVELNVKAGDVVKTGQVLAKTDSTKLGTAVLQAQASVTSAKAKLQTVKDGFNAQTKAQAQAALAGNQAKVAQAQDLLAKEKFKPDATAESLASLQASVTSAQANVTSSQLDLQQQSQGPKSADLQSAQASIDIAQVQLTTAKADVLGSSIISPMDAVVVSAPLQLYQQSDAKSIITITPAGNSLQVDASIDQSDIAQVKVGQIVDVTLDAYPDVHNSGTVSVVAVQGTIVSNVTTFVVTVAVDKASDLLRAGMNANIKIVVAEAKNVLIVPSEAIKTRGDKKSVLTPTISSSVGQANPAAQAGTTPKSNTTTGSTRTSLNGQNVPVEIGLDDGTNVEIKSGIKEGQEVITGTSSSTAAKAATAGFSFGGGGNRTGGNAGGNTGGNASGSTGGSTSGSTSGAAASSPPPAQ